jgi:hypothetical protein
MADFEYLLANDWLPKWRFILLKYALWKIDAISCAAAP